MLAFVAAVMSVAGLGWIWAGAEAARSRNRTAIAGGRQLVETMSSCSRGKVGWRLINRVG